jgi:hypothetical protein
MAAILASSTVLRHCCSLQLGIVASFNLGIIGGFDIGIADECDLGISIGINIASWMALV